MAEENVCERALRNYIEDVLREHPLPWKVDGVSGEVFIVAFDGFRVMDCGDRVQAEKYVLYAETFSETEPETETRVSKAA